MGVKPNQSTLLAPRHRNSEIKTNVSLNVYKVRRYVNLVVEHKFQKHFMFAHYGIDFSHFATIPKGTQ